MTLCSNYRLNRMDFWMSSLPGRRPGNKLFRPNRKSTTMSPQVTLHLDVQPPVLDTSGHKPPPMKAMDQGANPRKIWHSIYNMYQTFCTRSATPLVWVNPEMVNHPANYSQTYLPGGQYFAMEGNKNMNGGECPWYPANPNGSQLHNMEPFQVWQQKYYPYDPYHQPIPDSTNYPSKMSKCSQPLNPEAKEWIPKEQREKKESVHWGNGGVCQDFSEITEREIKAVRNVGKSEDTSPVLPIHTNKQAVHETSRGEKVADNILIETSNNALSTTMSKTNDNAPVSYAIAAKTVTSSPEPPRVPSPKDDQLSNGIDQKLPKIFLKDKKYPKEKAQPLIERNVYKLPFKTANKVQKKNSKKFLSELKASAHTESDCDSETSYGSPCSNTITHNSISQSNLHPPCGSPTVEKLKEQCVTPEARNPMTPRTISESSSNASRIRSNSESSVASVDSINIEFEEEVDKSNSVNGICSTSEKCQPKCIDTGKLSSSVALILGFSDCRSEDSDEDWDDSDSDWDAVDNNCMLDDSWETFGLGLTVTTCKSSSSSQKCEGKDSDKGTVQLEQSCDILDEYDDTYSCNLEAINKRWNEEIEKDISVRTESRISFGETKVRPMVTWAYAYQQARRGPWEQYARDGARFSRHISDLEAIIAPALEEKHRQQVYQKLYGNSSES